MGFYTGKNVLVTGGTGLIGRPLVEMLVDYGAYVSVVSLDNIDELRNAARGNSIGIYNRYDLRYLDFCEVACQGKDIVFQLAGIKGSPVATAKQPASFFVPTLQFSTNMMEAARRAKVGWYLNTSSIGVYGPAEIFHEDDAWEGKPSTHDKFAGWAKRIGEMQAEAYKIEYGWDCVTTVRPANAYGPWDSFSDESAMVIPSLIKRVCNGEKPLVAWGDGSPIRDFIHARDVARGMMIMVEKQVREPVNLGSGVGVTIKDLAETIAEELGATVEWDLSKPNGDKKRLMDTTRAESYGFKPRISLQEGIRETINWYVKNAAYDGRYSPFKEFA